MITAYTKSIRELELIILRLYVYSYVLLKKKITQFEYRDAAVIRYLRLRITSQSFRRKR